MALVAKAFFIYIRIYKFSQKMHIRSSPLALQVTSTCTVQLQIMMMMMMIKKKNKLKAFMSKSVINNDADGKLQFGFLQSVGTWTR